MIRFVVDIEVVRVIRFSTVCLLGNECIVYYQKCRVTIRFVTVCLLVNVVYCLLPKMQSNH